MSAINYELQYLLRNAEIYNIDGFLQTLPSIHALMMYRKHLAERVKKEETKIEDIKELLEMNKTDICKLLGIII